MNTPQPTDAPSPVRLSDDPVANERARVNLRHVRARMDLVHEAVFGTARRALLGRALGPRRSAPVEVGIRAERPGQPHGNRRVRSLKARRTSTRCRSGDPDLPPRAALPPSGVDARARY